MLTTGKTIAGSDFARWRLSENKYELTWNIEGKKNGGKIIYHVWCYSQHTLGISDQIFNLCIWPGRDFRPHRGFFLNPLLCEDSRWIIQRKSNRAQNQHPSITYPISDSSFVQSPLALPRGVVCEDEEEKKGGGIPFFISYSERNEFCIVVSYAWVWLCGVFSWGG